MKLTQRQESLIGATKKNALTIFKESTVCACNTTIMELVFN